MDEARGGRWFDLMTLDGVGWCAARSDGLSNGWSNSRFSGRQTGLKKQKHLLSACRVRDE